MDPAVAPAATVVIVDQGARGLADDDSVAWAAAAIEIVGRAPDVVFSSESYGPVWAALMGAAHVSVDPARTRVPISATAIRNDPHAHLGFFEAHVARAFQPRLACILGAESTGKTTLARDLAEHLDVPWIPEYGRIYTELLADPTGYRWSEDDFVAIAAAQVALEDTALATSTADVIVCDTDPWVTGVFCEEYLGAPSARVEAIAAPRRYDLLVLCDLATPFEEDTTGLREDGPRRARMHERYRTRLLAGDTPFVEVHGSRAERVAQASSAIAAMQRNGLGERREGVAVRQLEVRDDVVDPA